MASSRSVSKRAGADATDGGNGRRGKQRVRVFCRARPPVRTAGGEGADTFFTGVDDGLNNVLGDCDPAKGMVTLLKGDGQGRQYRFDGFLPPDIVQTDVYTTVAQGIVKDFMCGYNGTVFAYGQTGTGKTYTMLGPDAEPDIDPDASGGTADVTDVAGAGALAAAKGMLADREHRGIVPRAFADVFAAVDAGSDKYQYSVTMSYVQIYCELITDLLSNTSQSLSVREDNERGVYVDGVGAFPVTSPEDCLRLVYAGHENRVTASTKMNATSSRSHAVLIMNMERRPRRAVAGESKGGDLTESTAKVVRSSLFMVDLAGSERVKKTGVAGMRFNELRAINLSLSALGNCIAALAARKSHVPYRDSKLTRLLQGSLGGNAKTALIVTIGPEPDNLQETVSTMDFGQRARKVQVRAVVNQRTDFKTLYEDMRGRVDKESDTVTTLSLEVQALKKEVARLEGELAASVSARADMEAEAHAAAMSASTALTLRQLAEEGGDTSPAAVVERVREAFEQEMARVRKAHADEVASLTRRMEEAVLSQRLVAEEAGSKLDSAEMETGNLKDELLDIMTDYRKCRERLTEVEEDLNLRVADLMAELEQERKRADTAEEEAATATERWESAEQAMTKVMGRVKQDFVSRSHVNQMEKLYEESINRLTARVDQLEAANKAHAEAAARRGDTSVPGVAPRPGRASAPQSRADMEMLARRRSTSRERMPGLQRPPPGARAVPAGGRHSVGARPVLRQGPDGSAGGGGGRQAPSGVDPESAAMLSSLMSFKNPGARRAPGSVLGGRSSAGAGPPSRAPGAILMGGGGALSGARFRTGHGATERGHGRGPR